MLTMSVAEPLSSGMGVGAKGNDPNKGVFRVNYEIHMHNEDKSF